MKAFLFAVSLCLLLSFTAAQEPNCNNLIIQLAKDPFSSSWASSLPFLDSPAPTPDNTVCRNIVGEESCCAAEFFTAVDEAWTNVRIAMGELQQEINALSSQLSSQHELAKQQYYAQIDSYPDLTSSQKSQLKSIVGKILSAMDKFADKAKSSFVPCISAMLRYSIGFVCLACREIPYLDVVSATEAYMNLAGATCDDLGGACAPILVVTRDVLNAIDEFVNQLCVFVPSDVECFDFNITEEVLCTDSASCKAYVCNSMTNGFIIADTFGDATEDSKKRVVAKKMIKDFGLNKVFDAMKKLRSAERSLKSRQNSIQLTAQYSSSGYDASAVGKQSSLDTSAPYSSAAQLSSWVSLLL